MENSGNSLGASLLGQEAAPQEKRAKIDVIEISAEAPGTTRLTKKKVKLYTRSVFIDGYYVFTLASGTGLLMCALWPLCESLGGSKIQLG